MKYIGTIGYLVFIFLVNLLFPVMPVYRLWGSPYSGCDIIIGAIYILRDFSQREIGGKVLYVMIAGCAASYVFASKQIVIASICSFLVGETIDWAVYTFTRKPFSQRLLTSSLFSIPADSAVFLYLINQLNAAGLLVMTLAKSVGILFIWLSWRFRQGKNPDYQQTAIATPFTS
jgi:queuosine precursor transporter